MRVFGRIRRGIALVTASLVVASGLVGVVLPTAAHAANNVAPPPVDACYSQAGYCNGAFMKSAVAPTLVTTPLAEDDMWATFTFTSPSAGINTTTPVACGDAGCLYNHYDWNAYAQFPPYYQVVSGCGTDQDTCTVRIPRGSANWVPMVASLNDYPTALWLMFAPAAGLGIVQGTVSDGLGHPVAGATVTITGPGTNASGLSGSDGSYSWQVHSGQNYVVTVTDGQQGVYSPASPTIAVPNGTIVQNFTKVIKPATLSVSVHPTLAPGGLGVGDTLSVPVTVAASGGDIGNIGFGVTPVINGHSVAITERPAVPANFSLAAGASQTFTYVVKVTSAGTSSFDATATGWSSGTTVTASDSSTLRSVNRQLKITIASTPNPVKLMAEDNGKIAAKFISVRVKLANTGRTALKHVQLLSLNPVPVHNSQQLDQLAFARGTFPIRLGTIAVGANRVETLKLKVTGDGEYVFDALALYADPGGPRPNARATAHTGAFKAVVPLLFLKAAREGSETVPGGDAWFVTGHVKNLSSYQTLCLSPLSPRFTGNAGGLGPHQIGVVPVDEPAPPLAGPLRPGKTISFLMAVHTDADGTTRSGVALKPRATLGEAGDSCNVLTTDRAAPISAAKMKIAQHSESFTASVDNSNVAAAGAGAFEFFGSYGKGSYKTIGKLFESCAALAKEYDSVDKLVAAMRRIDPAGAVDRAAVVLGDMSHATSAVANFWIHASPLERQALLDTVSNDFVARTHEVWDGVQAAVQQSARGWFDNVVSAYYSHDISSMFSALGNSGGEGLTQLAIDTAKFEIGLAVLKKGAALTRVALRVGEESTLIQALREMPAGKILNLAEMERLWGLSQADYAAFKAIAEEEGVLIGVRGRSPVSVKNLEEGAVWKHENIKPKNVNDIDTEFLGFSNRDTGTVAFRTYTNREKARILRNIDRAGLNAQQKQAVLDRAATRFGEKRYLSQLEGFAAQGQIDVGFGYRGNGLDVDPTGATRKFALDAQKVEGGTVYRPFQENPALDGLSGGTLPPMCESKLGAVLCRVTGDMDGVYLINKGGTSIDPVKRFRIYQKLARAGWQHPETLTWLTGDGSFFTTAKKRILEGLQVGGEAMIEFGTDGIARATYLDLSKSHLFAVESYYIDIVGGEYAP